MLSLARPPRRLCECGARTTTSPRGMQTPKCDLFPVGCISLFRVSVNVERHAARRTPNVAVSNSFASFVFRLGSAVSLSVGGGGAVCVRKQTSVIFPSPSPACGRQIFAPFHAERHTDEAARRKRDERRQHVLVQSAATWSHCSACLLLTSPRERLRATDECVHSHDARQ